MKGRKKLKRMLAVGLSLSLICGLLTGCTEAERVSAQAVQVVALVVKTERPLLHMYRLTE